jgi:hypothetical protein
VPTWSTDCPVLIDPDSMRPATTVPRPVMVKTSCTVSRKSLAAGSSLSACVRRNHAMR